ncbi:MAG TPA: SLC13 family permease [Anaerolineae bacterium]|nr:SLC13 family permease [Anaerolineae bacterium]
MSERVPFDVAAVIITGLLLVTGIVSVEQGLSGFSNEATITIAAMFVLSEGVRRTGILEGVGRFFSTLGRRNFWLGLGVMMGVVGVISAFVNNTAIVAIFIPVVLGVAKEMGVSPSKLLMPISFASMFGGVCTLIGTSTNLVVSSIAEAHGVAPFAMFEMAPLGLVFFVVGFAYLFFIGVRLIPNRRGEGDLTSSFEMHQYLTDVVVEADNKKLGQTVGDAQLDEALDLEIVQVFTAKEEQVAMREQRPLHQGDILRVAGSASEIDKLVAREGVTLKPTKEWYDVDFEQGMDALVEAVVAPESSIPGQTIGDVDFMKRFGAAVLAIRRKGEVQQDKLKELRLSGGDSLLLTMERERIKEIQNDPAFAVVTEIELTRYRYDKQVIALAILALVVLVAAFTAIPIVVTSLLGAISLVLTGCLQSEEVYEAINWKVIFLLAGILPLGIAMQETGAADLLADGLLGTAGRWGPTAVISAFFLVAILLTSVISNQATAALLAPIALQAATTLGVDARPLLLAITFAASLSFMTPIGYQTNTLIYGPGQYKFTDFTKVGLPLNIIFWLLATFLLPILYPF